MYRKIKLVACSVLFAIAALPVLAAGLDARLSANRVAEGDQVVLTLSKKASNGAQPDLSVLDADFTVLGTSSGKQTSIVNGVRSDRYTWQVTMVPKQAGTLTVPAIKAGSESSAPLTVSVIDAADLPPAARAGRPSITASLPDTTVHVHQEIPVTLNVRLPAGTQGAAITPPQATGMLIEQNGEDQVTRQSDGTALMQRTYLIRPQTQGEITLGGFTVTAEVADPNQPDLFGRMGRSPFGSSIFDDFLRQGPFGKSPFGSAFVPSRRLAATSDPLTLDVQATPKGETGWALPARSVELREIWLPDPPELRVGEAVTRKIQVIALGAHAEQIPDLTLPDVPGARLYFDGSEKRSVATEDGTAAIREFTWSIVPTSGGELALPEVTVDWFDTGREEAARSTLAARRFHVAGPVIAPATPPEPGENGVTTHLASAQVDKWMTPGLIATIIAVVVLLAVVGRLAFRTLRKRRRTVQADPAPAAPSAKRARRAAIARAERAARNGDKSGVHRAVLDWVRAAGQSNDGAHLRFPSLGSAINELEAELFGNRAATGSIKNAIIALKSAEADLAATKEKSAALPPLYPEMT